MKTTLKLAVAIAIIALCSNVSAQTQKLAHINIDELIVSMAEYDSASMKLQKEEKGLSEELELLQVEQRRKYEEFTKNQGSWTELVKQSKAEDIQSMNAKIEQYQQWAMEKLQQMQSELMQPILEKANKAVESVAKEQGITYVISGNPQILLFKAVGTTDLLPAVKAHLGIKK
jgi:outer membrane protein